MRPALELRDLLDQVRELVRVEVSLFRAEISERTRGIPSSLMAVGVGGVLLCVSLGLVLVAASLALLRCGRPLRVGVSGGGCAWGVGGVGRDGVGGDHSGSGAEAVRDSAGSIVESGTKVFREGAEAKRREFVDVAQSQVATGATMLSDEIGKKLENYIDRLPSGINVRPLIESSVQIALAAALEALLRKRNRA